MPHEGFEGYIGEVPAGAYFAIDRLPHEDRPNVEAMYDLFLIKHVGQVVTVLLGLVTEIQRYFRFDGADINNRIEDMWIALMGLFEAKELYEERYSALMKENGIAGKSCDSGTGSCRRRASIGIARFRAPCNRRLQTPPGLEGSNGSGLPRVPRITRSLA